MHSNKFLLPVCKKLFQLPYPLSRPSKSSHCTSYIIRICNSIPFTNLYKDHMFFDDSTIEKQENLSKMTFTTYVYVSPLDRNFRRRNFPRRSFRRRFFCHLDFSQCGIFAVRIFCRTEFSPHGTFAVRKFRPTEFSPKCINWGVLWFIQVSQINFSLEKLSHHLGCS